jgi:hypothetical protein
MTKNNLPNQAVTENKIAPTKALETDPYRKKIIHFKKRIVFGLSALALILVVLFGFNFYDKASQENNVEQITLIEAQLNDLRTKSAGTEAKINDAKKFKQLWILADNKRKNFNGIKISDVNNDFTSLAEKNNITKSSITLSVPDILKDGVYQLQTLDVNLVNCNIAFDALTDRAAIDFIESFINSLPGYVIINELSIKNNKKEGYSTQDLADISSGKFPNLVSGKVNFSWYFLKRKPKAAAPKNAS